MHFFQAILMFITTVFFTLSLFFMIRTIFIYKIRNKYFYFALTALGGSVYVLFEFFLTYPITPELIIIFHKIRLFGLMFCISFWFYCAYEICFQEKKFPFLFMLFSGVLALTVPTPLFTHLPTHLIQTNVGFALFEYRFGTVGITYSIYALGLLVSYGIIIFRVFTTKLRAHQKLFGYAALAQLIGAFNDFAVVHGYIKSIMITEYLAVIFVVGIFLTFIIDEQADYDKITNMNRFLEKEIHLKTRELEEKNRQLLEMASIDPLTGLINRQELYHQLDIEKNRVDRYTDKNHPSFVLVFIDLDNFKYFNDNFGHDLGDYLLRLFSQFLLANVRDVDFCARYGGDEFMVLLPCTDVPESIMVMERCFFELKKKCYFKEELTNYLKNMPAELEYNLGFSAGLVQYEKGMDLETLVKRADCTLYQIKKTHKNSYKVWVPDNLEEVEVLDLS